VGNKTATSPWRIRVNGGRVRHGCRGWLARVPGLAVGGDACVRRAASRTERGEGEADKWGPAGDFYFLLFFGL
jgi:hypothetical protein